MPSHNIHSTAQEIFPLISGIGFGGLFFPPIIAMQAAMPLKDMATSTAAVGLFRQLGSTIGVSVGQAIWTSVSTGYFTLTLVISESSLGTSSTLTGCARVEH